ncbi:hypothetical protein T07_10032 [Trichinella nelsoni]|uniref:Uncharacterized protein n=1 Tax=Trichinella nelsoni TaxID=6336 RepID=A0A0V0SHJ1_9BILA|nr:hypothetical protein T07_14185 [Trichinella nelsoni]KRX26272.1 hypothetical protein T07_10032 [Trichinella nelsoni]
MFSDDGHEHSLSPPHNKISDADYGDSQCSSSIQEGDLQLSAISKSRERIELYFRYSTYHPEASTPRDPLFFTGQLSLFTTPNPLWESLL